MRSPAGRPLCSVATESPGSAWRTRATSCGVRLISGTSISTWRPLANTGAAAARYTSVLPLPVTPLSRNGANAPSAFAISSTAWRCASLSVCDTPAVTPSPAGTPATKPSSRHARSVRFWCGGNASASAAGSTRSPWANRSRSARAAGARVTRPGSACAPAGVSCHAAATARGARRAPRAAGGIASPSASPSASW